MIIKFSTQRAEIQTTAKIKGNIFTYNKENLDLSQFENGSAAKSDFLTIEKDTGGNITITMIWQYKTNTEINCFPADLEISDLEVENGIDIEPKEVASGL